MTDHALETLTRLFGLDKQVAVVTGASAGIGRDIARSLAHLGAHVVVAARNSASAQCVVEQIEQEGGQALALPLEVSSEDSVIALFRAVKSSLGRLDILVNNAGVFPETPLLDTTAAQWDAIHRTNALGTFLCLREAAKIMKDVGQGGRIINISSNASLRSSVAGRFAYNASKAAVNRLTQEAALELAVAHILVNAVLPGPIATEKLDERDPVIAALRATVVQKIPLGRWGSMQDISSAVIYLASAAGGFITGQTLVVDGGAMLV